MIAAGENVVDEADVRRERHASAEDCGSRRASAHDGEAGCNAGPSATGPARRGSTTVGEDGGAASNYPVDSLPPFDDRIRFSYKKTLFEH